MAAVIPTVFSLPRQYPANLIDRNECAPTRRLAGGGVRRAYFEVLKSGIKAMFNVTAMEHSILAELSERGGRGQLSGQNRRPIERLVNKGFIERHTLKSQQEEYVLTAIGKKVLDNN